MGADQSREGNTPRRKSLDDLDLRGPTSQMLNGPLRGKGWQVESRGENAFGSTLSLAQEAAVPSQRDRLPNAVSLSAVNQASSGVPGIVTVNRANRRASAKPLFKSQTSLFGGSTSKLDMQALKEEPAAVKELDRLHRIPIFKPLVGQRDQEDKSFSIDHKVLLHVVSRIDEHSRHLFGLVDSKQTEIATKEVQIELKLRNIADSAAMRVKGAQRPSETDNGKTSPPLLAGRAQVNALAKSITDVEDELVSCTQLGQELEDKLNQLYTTFQFKADVPNS